MCFSVSCLLSICFVLCCLWGEGQTVQGAMLVCPRGSCGNTTCRLFAHLLVYVSQADLELVSGGTGALLFSKYDMAWSSFVRAGGSGCQNFDCSWLFFSANCGSSVSARFLVYGAHAILVPKFYSFLEFLTAHLCILNSLLQSLFYVLIVKYCRKLSLGFGGFQILINIVFLVYIITNYR
jgi:hypothetical protein